MSKNFSDDAAYAKLIDSFKSRRSGATVADLVASTALPLEKVKELVPRAADEFSGRLEVTESGEILYSFPHSFKSKYKGFGPAFKRLSSSLKKGFLILARYLFKAWIVVMLVGYFMLFMAIALVALAASVALSASGNSNNESSSRRGGGLGSVFLASRIFNFFIRIWFYSELTKSMDGSRHGRYYGTVVSKPKRRPLHNAVFSFVFGDKDPNSEWSTKERQSVIHYLESKKGVISLPEYMTLTGKTPLEAEQDITSFCVEFGGSPEATEDGTLVYRFDELLKRADKVPASSASLSAATKRLKVFSSNPKKMNNWFIGLNAVNLLFGSYFLYSAISVGPLLVQEQITGASYLYAIAHVLFSGLQNPSNFILIVLGIVPIVFASLFYAIPFLRSKNVETENEEIKMENLRKEAFRRVWENPLKISPGDFNPQASEARPSRLDAGREQVLKELGTYSNPDVSMGSDGTLVYSFTDLDREKQALEKYRTTIRAEDSELGKTIFDSHS